MAEFLRLISYVLAAFRLTHLLWWENGPGDIFDWLRVKAGIRWEKQDEEANNAWYAYNQYTYYPVRYEQRVTDGSFWAELLNCPLCLSLWVGAVMAALMQLRMKFFDAVAVWLAISGVCLMLFGWEKDK